MASLLAISLILVTADRSHAAKTCYDCHKKEKEQYSKLKYVHDPVKQEDCESCHKRHGFAQQLILDDDTSELCYGCHTELKERYSEGDVHFPVERGKCWDCHAPHGSDSPGLLHATPEDSGLDHFCLVCHKENFDAAMGREFHHAPYEGLECLVCHDPHNSSHGSLLTGETNALCGSCHDVSDKGWIDIHQSRHATGLPCSDCHSGHASDSKGLLAANAHAPFAGGECEICHSVPDVDGKVVFEEGVSPGEVCAACHDDIIEMSSREYPHAAVEADNCNDCHNSHSSRHGSLLKMDQTQLCGECHDGILTGSGKQPHFPAVDGQCSECHEVHGGDWPSLVKSEDAGLCLGCHNDFAQAQETAANVHAAAEDCLGCHSPHEGLPPGILKAEAQALCGDCHEPDRKGLGATSGHQPYLTGNCADCHVPHFSDAAHLARGGAEVCLACHADVAKRVNMPVPHAPAVDDCQSCHQAHYSDQLDLLSSAQKDLCESCHDYDDLNLSKEYVHTAAANGDCSGCHNPHGGQRAKLVTGRMTKIDVGGLKVGQLPKLGDKSSDLCYTCHEDLVEPFRAQNTHEPVAMGQCDACHEAHGSDHAGFVTAGAPELCSGCHAVDDTLSAVHGGYDLTSSDCLDCHNPHVSDQEKLVRSMVHPPFAEGGCESCHEKGADNKVAMVAATGEVCGACHESISEAAEKAHQHAPFIGDECTSCHGVHAADQEKLLRAQGGDLCLGCHSGVKEQADLAVIHRPFEKGECLECHAPHSSAYAGLTIKPAESFCLSCHTDLAREIEAGSPHAPVVGGECGACHVPHAGTEPALLTQAKAGLCGDCHDLTSSESRAAHRGFDLAGVDCQNCHVAHVGPADSKGLLAPDSHAPFADGDCSSCHEGTSPHKFISPVSELCTACHDDFLAAATQATVVHAPLKEEGGCASCHGPHVGYGSALQLKSGVGTCIMCHDGSEFKGSKKHEVAFEDCGNCHQPHTSSYQALLSSADIMELCITCHEDAVKTHYHPMGVGVIDPRTKEALNCIGCHSAHSSDHEAILVAEKDRKLCIICHTVAQ